ncbi:MAG: exonuclease SbcCD subunit D [Sporolactobacillus sp.]
MRALHTADWHLGRTLEGRKREDEQAAVLDEMCRIADEQQVDIVLMAGDVFDSVNPPASAEALFYDTAQRLSLNGQRPLVVIAGNHDSPDRLEAARPLANRQGITIIGRPVVEPVRVPIKRTDELLVLSCVPYPSEARLNEVLSAVNEETKIQAAYDRRLAALFAEHAAQFQKDTVNLLMSHLFVAGGRESASERPIQVGGAYTVSPSAFPAEAQYIALGHLHRPQTIHHQGGAIRYAGSPLAYSFSEAGQTKSVTIIDAQPGKSAQIESVPLSAGRPLVTWQAPNGIEEVRHWLDEGHDAGAWIDLEITLRDALSIHDIQDLRQRNDHFVSIRPIYPDKPAAERRAIRSLPIDQLFIRFYEEQMQGAEPEENLVQLFLQLVNEETAESEAAAGVTRDATD